MNSESSQTPHMKAQDKNYPRVKGAALITGASSGIGYELAKLFAAEGHPLILVARRTTLLETISQDLQQQYQILVKSIICDLSETNAAENLFAEIQHESLKYLVNNAGFGNYGEFAHINLMADQRLLQLNIVTLTLLTKLCLPLLKQHEDARILQVASTAAFQPGPYLATYYASKAYVLSFSQALVYELRHSSVKVTCLCPGPTATEFHVRANLENTRLFQHQMMSAEEVAKIGYRAMLRGKPVIIPGWKNKLLISLSRLAPTCLSTRAAGYLNQQRGT